MSQHSDTSAAIAEPSNDQPIQLQSVEFDSNGLRMACIDYLSTLLRVARFGRSKWPAETFALLITSTDEHGRRVCNIGYNIVGLRTEADRHDYLLRVIVPDARKHLNAPPGTSVYMTASITPRVNQPVAAVAAKYVVVPEGDTQSAWRLLCS